jgi:hypothetical protein
MDSERLQMIRTRAALLGSRQKAGEDSDRLLAVRCLTMLLKFFELSSELPKTSPEYGFAWFRRTHPKFPLLLEARRVPFSLAEFCINPDRNHLWKTYLEVLSDNQGEPCGLISTVGHTPYLIHNDWSRVAEVPGGVRILRAAASRDKGVTLEKYENYLVAVKLSGGF